MDSSFSQHVPRTNGPLIPGDPGVLADTLAHPPQAYDSLLFSVGTQPLGSLRDYYRDVSRGQFDIDGVVTRWYISLSLPVASSSGIILIHAVICYPALSLIDRRSTGGLEKMARTIGTKVSNGSHL